MVPLLITSEVRDAMDLLRSTRTECGVPVDNKHFFATDSQNGFMNSWLVLHGVAIAAKVERPDLITSTRLRKYVATLAQVKKRCLTVYWGRWNRKRCWELC